MSLTLWLAVLLCVALGTIGVSLGVDAHVTTWREWHHLYLVPLLLVVGGILASPLVLVLAAYVALDDGLEHVVAGIRGDTAKGWSPLFSIVLPLLWRIPGVAAIGRWLDGLLGKPPA